MVIDMNDSQLTILEQIQAFLAGTAAAVFTPPSDDAGAVGETLAREKP